MQGLGFRVQGLGDVRTQEIPIEPPDPALRVP